MRFTILFLLIGLCACSQQKVFNSLSKAPIVGSYTLINNAVTSAGVYNTDGTLVRTLWSGEQTTAGVHIIRWDGTDDFFQALPVANYTIKVLSNNVTYQRQGVIGNNSLSGGIHKSLTSATNISISGGNAYYASVYAESNASHYQFALSNPRYCLNSFPFAANQITDFVCTDGTNNYWTVWDSNSGDQTPKEGKYSFIYATKVSDNTVVSFSSGGTYKVVLGNQFNSSALDLRSTIARPSGIAVSSSYIFVSYANKGIIAVVSKSTGALVREISMTATCMAVDGTNIWIYTTSLQKYPINSDGTLGTPTLAISGVSIPVDVRINSSMLAVVDGGTSQQIKTYNTSTGASIWTLGQAGGVLNSAIVANDNFGFWLIDESSSNKKGIGGIAFASDGSFWVCDPSNKRMQHFDANRNFIENIIYQPKSYSTYVDPNNHARFICNLTEFQIDYTSAIGSSWIMRYNWEGNWQAGYNLTDGIRDITTFPNGKTYGLVIISGNYELIELTTSGIRYTGKLFYGGSSKMYANGDVYSISGTGVGETQVFSKCAFLNTYTSNTPNYSSPTTVLSINSSINTIDNPQLSGAHILPHEVTSSNLLVTFKGNKNNAETGSYYHLGGYDLSTNTYKFKTAIGTREDYQGDFPAYGYFDAGNSSQYQANVAMAIERSIIWGYNGEFWKGSEVNKYNHVYDNGLFIGQFGATGPEYNAGISDDFAGNAYSPYIIKEGSDYYMYHNDESVHGGPSRWKIGNLSSIQEQSIPITTSFARVSELSTTGVDLLSGLTPISALQNNTAGWSFTSGFNSQVYLGFVTYDNRKSTGINIESSSVATLTRTLGSNTNLNAWSIKGKVTSSSFSTSSGYYSIEIKDNAGKIICQFIPDYTDFTNYGVGWQGTRYYSVLNTAASAFENKFGFPTDINFTASAGLITLTFGNYAPISLPVYDNTANWRNPTTCNIVFTGGFHKIGIIELSFNNNPLLP